MPPASLGKGSGNWTSSPSLPHLERGLSFIATASIIVTTVIGTGVFLKARVMTCNVGTPGMVLLAYVAAGLFALAGAITYAELSTIMPRAGGPYNFLGAAFGRPWAFLLGWTRIIFGGGAGQAAKAAVFVIFFNDLMGGSFSTAEARWLTVGTLLSITLLALVSIGKNGAIVTGITILKILLVAGIGIVAFVYGDGSWQHFSETGAAGSCEGVPASARLGLAGFGAAMIGALWSYDGWGIVSQVAGEVKNPYKNLPRALIGSTVLLMALYLSINAGYFYMLKPIVVGSVSETSSVAGVVLLKLIGAAGASVMAAGLMLSTYGSLHAAFVANARVPYAMARDGLLPKIFARLTTHTHVPVYATLLIGLLTMAFAFSGTFDVLTDLAIFSALIFNGMAVASVYVLRKKLPNAPRPYKVWGYPWVPGLFVLATAYLMINTLIATPGRAIAGILLTAAGLLVYWYYARKLPPDRPEDWLPDEDEL